MRDRADNCVIICSIENVDPMGVHTGDSITVAPAQTLTDVEYQAHARRRVRLHPPRRRRDRRLQRAVRRRPGTGRQVVIEMNPRVSRSSALASKATGFPIAKIAAKLAVGYTLDEIPNDITRATPASFEPVIDYVVTKVPRWAFEKLPGTSRRARHADAVGRRGDGDRAHLPGEPAEGAALARAGPPRAQLRPGRGRAGHRAPTRDLLAAIAVPTPDRIFQVGELLRRGVRDRGDPPGLPHRRVVPRPDAGDRRGAPGTSHGLASRTTIDASRLAAGQATRVHRRPARPPVGHRRARSSAERGRRPVCTRRTRPSTPVPPSSPPRRRTTTRRGRTRTRCRPSDRPRVVILGSGPNRIGQGIEFDYCCVHASFALRDAGLRDGDDQLQPGDRVHRLRHSATGSTSSRSRREDVLNVIAAETAAAGGVAPKVIVSLGGQTPLKLASRDPARADRRHVADVDRPGRGPREVERAVRRAAHPAAAGRHRRRPRAGARDRRRRSASRCWCARATCSADGRCRSCTTSTSHLAAGDGRAGRASARSGREGGLSAERPGADRPLPGGRHRGRRRRHPRPHRRGADRRRDGARRGGRRALRRLGVRDPAADAAAVGGRGDRGVHHGDRQARSTCAA